ncbi:hypothetical protein [Nocardioides astragali]|uniref:Uncharacterized protein n=1 Tax=Nocardioides astragali TaxID=1776736 RepID=A0ABW2N488_9ACTN|nr:hypothetical protein [Nocardioides astragali]
MTRLNSVPVALPQGVPGIRINTDWARKVAEFMRANARATSAGLTAVVAVGLVVGDRPGRMVADRPR